MSQQKVDKYKQDKANRSQIIKKQKRAVRIEFIAAAVVMIGLVGWFAHSYYDRVAETKPPVEYPIDSAVVDEYLNDLNTPADEADGTVEEEEQ